VSAGRLTDKVAIITGAGSGVGEATARRFVAEGAKVALLGRSADSLEQVAGTLGDAALSVPCDITDEQGVKAAVSAVVDRFGAIDILVNNANALVPGMLADHDLGAWRASFATAADGPMLLMRECFPQLAGGGAVVNVSSVCGELATPGVAGYSAAKAALQSLTRSAAIEWARQGVRVNAIVIGVVMTPATEAAIPDPTAQAATANSVPLGRIGTPEEAANAILFLASDEASYITGAALHVDGGRTAELNSGAADWEN
jgi:NAD(P)-dependent dehydrogenase (short-subunit alcohol dehydrogenase family)